MFALFSGKEFTALLISTVRTKSGIADESKNLGFLSDPKLMNTAISRVRCYVAVIGDPFTLCTVGRCRKLWFRYIETCHRSASLNPPDVTLKSIVTFVESEQGFTDDAVAECEEPDADEILMELARQAQKVPPHIPVAYSFVADEGFAVQKFGSSVESKSAVVRQTTKVKGVTELVTSQPHRYALCKLDVISDDDIKADVIKNKHILKEDHIRIDGIANCQPAFNSDEVVVDVESRKVVGIVREFYNREEMRITCQADTRRMGLLRPFDPKLPAFKSFIEERYRKVAKQKGQIAIYTITGRCKKLKKLVAVDSTRLNNTLFVVKFLRWDSDFKYPLGIVVDEMSCGCDFDSGLKFLALNHQIRQNFRPRALVESDKAQRDSICDVNEIFKDLLDYQHIPVFTVDSERSQDLDDALSLHQLKNGNLCLGIHISDVSYFVRKETCLDSEAKSRQQTFYRDHLRDPLIPMFPHKLSTTVFSLLPGERRRVITFWFEIDSNNKRIVKESGPMRCCIKSHEKFSHTKVDQILSNNQEDPLAYWLRLLFNVVKTWNPFCNNAHDMVRELMELANRTAAKRLLEKFPHCVPLFVEPTPSEVTTGNENPVEESSEMAETNGDYFSILKPVWFQVMKTALDENVWDARQLIKDANSHPSDIWREFRWTDDETGRVYVSSARYDCSAFNKDPYVRVTSPMRRYMDLVTQRLLAALTDDDEPVYSEEEIHELCEHSNCLSLKCNQFKLSLKQLECALLMKQKSRIWFPYVKQYTLSKLVLKFPSLPESFTRSHNLAYNTLDLVRSPDICHYAAVNLPWEQRIYDAKFVGSSTNTQSDRPTNDELPSAKKRCMFILPRDAWHSVFNAARFSSMNDFIKTLKKVHNDHLADQIRKQENLKSISDRSSESLNGNGGQFREHYVPFSISLHRGSLIQVQMSAEVVDGLLRPVTQLLCLTPKLHVCIEHHANQLKCFATESADEASKHFYQSVEEYQKAWQPVLNMEAANSAVTEGGASIHNVRIRWFREESDIITGKFALAMDFCKLRHISFYPMNAKYFSKDYVLLPEESAKVGHGEFDFLCIRYHGSTEDSLSHMLTAKFTIEEDGLTKNTVSANGRPKTYAEAAKAPPSARSRFKERYAPETPSWVGHAVVTRVSRFTEGSGKTAKKMILVKFRLHQHMSDFPEALLRQGNSMNCTVEWLPKQTPHQ